MLNSLVCYCAADVFVIVFNKMFKKLQMTHAQEDGEAYFAVGEDFKRCAEHSFVIATSDLCLRSRLTCEYSNGRDAIVASAAPLQSQLVCIRLKPTSAFLLNAFCRLMKQRLMNTRWSLI